MFIFILSCMFLLTSFSLAEAFTFSPYIDISKLPENEYKENSVMYDMEDVVEDENKISAPPGTEIEIGVMDGDYPYFTSLNAVVFLSKEIVEHGDLTQLLDIELPYSEIPYFEDGRSWDRQGKMYTGKVYINGGKDSILTTYIKYPLNVISYEYSIENGFVDIKTVVKNDTNRLLNNIKYSHEEFSLTRNFQAGEEYTYEYTLEYSEDMEYPEIYDPNIKQTCVSSDSSVSNTHVIFLQDSEGVFNYDYKMADGDDFCVMQTAYTLVLGKVEEKTISDEKEEESKDVSEILGISILPKTGEYSMELVLIGVFLVAFGILCYYFTNENSIRDA